jgi:signal transduction histidine kinase
MARQRPDEANDLTILIVDDQEEVPRSLRGVLERLGGYRVLAADSAEAALAVLATEKVDLALVDQVMPKKSGIELIAEIRAIRPLLPIILNTGYAGERPAEELVDELGLQGYHDKADGPDKLLLWIAAALRTHRSLSSLQQRALHHDEVLAEVSHELRAPLQCISGFADLLVEESLPALPEPARPALRSLARTAHRLNDLVVNCLTRAQLDGQALAVSPRCVAVAEVADELRLAAEHLLADAPLRFAIDRHLAPPALYTDPAVLGVILRNLIDNAAERTASGSITLFIAREGSAARLAVADNGPAIDAERLQQLFTADAAAAGSGHLALVVSGQLARLLGGTLSVYSHPQGGAVFTLVIPDAARDMPDATADATPGAPRDGDRGTAPLEAPLHACAGETP